MKMKYELELTSSEYATLWHSLDVWTRELKEYSRMTTFGENNFRFEQERNIGEIKRQIGIEAKVK